MKKERGEEEEKKKKGHQIVGTMASRKSNKKKNLSRTKEKR
jgi:hypothetical protein